MTFVYRLKTAVLATPSRDATARRIFRHYILEAPLIVG